MRGYTLLELLIVIAIIVIVAILISGAFSSFRTNNSLVEADSNIIGFLNEARSNTLGSLNNNTWGVHFEQTKIVLFSGAVYNAADSANTPYPLPFDLQISAINLGGPTEVVFARLTGDASISGTVTISSRRNAAQNRIVTILPKGNVK